MRVNLLHAHPLEDSFSAALRSRAVSALTRAGHEVVLSCLGTGDDPGPRSCDLAGTDALVFVHPVWWGGPPAPLLAWIQRELGPWIDSSDQGESPLRSVKHLVAVVTHGSSRLVNILQGEPGRQLLRRSVLPLCAAGARLEWIALYQLDRLSRQELDLFLAHVDVELARLTTAAGA